MLHFPLLPLLKLHHILKYMDKSLGKQMVLLKDQVLENSKLKTVNLKLKFLLYLLNFKLIKLKPLKLKMLMLLYKLKMLNYKLK